MIKITHFLQKSLTEIENAPISFSLWLGAFLSIILARLFIESWIAGFSRTDPEFLFAEFTHTFLFFLFSYLLFLLLLKRASRVSLKTASNVLLLGFLIILLPPIIDHIISRGAGFWSFYTFDSLSGLLVRFFTFFGDRPDIGITYGVRVEVALSLFLFCVYIFKKTKRLIHSIVWTLLAYCLFFLLGTFPSWIAILTLGFQKGFFNVGAPEIAQMFLTPEIILSRGTPELLSVLNIKMSIVYGVLLSALIPLLGFFSFRKETLSLAQNARLPQILYHGGLVCLGAGLAILLSSKIFQPSFFDVLAFLLLIISVGFAWLTSVVTNDLFDIRTDRITNTSRPLITKSLSPNAYRQCGWVFFGASLLLAGITIPFAIPFLLFYQALAWSYSAPPLRLKRIPLVATFVSALASILLFFLGFLALSPTNSIATIPNRIIILLLSAYTLSLPIKDLKDLQGDKKDGVYTLPIIFGETKGRLIIASGIFFSFMLSVWAFNDPSLTFPAILFGALAFWIVATSHKWQRFSLSPRHLPHITLFLVTLYGIILTSSLL